MSRRQKRRQREVANQNEQRKMYCEWLQIQWDTLKKMIDSIESVDDKNRMLSILGERPK